MQSSIVDVTVYGLAWLFFAVLHSSMASDRFKEPLMRFLGPMAAFERLIYNGVSVVAIHEVLSFGRLHLAQAPLLPVTGWIDIPLLVGQMVGGLLLLWSLAAYDLWRLVGLRQIWLGFFRHRTGPEPMARSFLHRYVRHPLYGSALILLWCRPPTERILWTNLFATLYLLVGLGWEEKRLLVLYGDAYERYQKAVPALIPHPHRRWQPEAEAET